MLLNSQQWQRAETLLGRCLELSQEDCDRILADECSDDLAVHEAVRDLIASARSTSKILETPSGKFCSQSFFHQSASSLLGRVLNGRFTVLALIGVGGMGEVYRVHDQRLGRTVAIKVLRPELVQDPQWRLRFEQEARAISSLNHGHICALYDLQEVDDIVALLSSRFNEHRSGWQEDQG